MSGCRAPATLAFRECRRSEEHTSELQSQSNLVCRLLLEKKKKKARAPHSYGATSRQTIDSVWGHQSPHTLNCTLSPLTDPDQCVHSKPQRRMCLTAGYTL